LSVTIPVLSVSIRSAATAAHCAGTTLEEKRGRAGKAKEEHK
jgi:hypothetical protein